MKSFQQFALSDSISRALFELGFQNPSPIQAETIPLLLGVPTDFVGLAATGTGKTAAFGIPLLEKIDVSRKETQAIVLCPTRELALQVAGQLDLIGKYLGIRALPIYGGSDYANQIARLQAGASIVVGTPGRLIDHLERGRLKLENVKTIVLDEADEMISMGFKEDLDRILCATNRDHANVWLFSATMGNEVLRVSQDYLRNPRQVKMNRKDVLSEKVVQSFYPTHESDKPEVLCKLIESSESFYGLVFCQTKALVVDLTNFLVKRGYDVDCLHGDKDQTAREKTLQRFRDKAVTLLVCTDVASRGIDVKDITHVVNFSLPRELENYVHRIGRTARGGKEGIALSFVAPSQRHLLTRIEKITKSKITEARVPSRREMGEKKILKTLTRFSEQRNYQKALELLDDNWNKTISKMSSQEIVARFISMLAPEVFDDRKKSKAILGQRVNSSLEKNFRPRDFFKKRSEKSRPPRNRPKKKASQSFSRQKDAR